MKFSDWNGIYVLADSVLKSTTECHLVTTILYAIVSLDLIAQRAPIASARDTTTSGGRRNVPCACAVRSRGLPRCRREGFIASFRC